METRCTGSERDKGTNERDTRKRKGHLQRIITMKRTKTSTIHANTWNKKRQNRHYTSKAVVKGHMGSALMGSLHILCLFDRGRDFLGSLVNLLLSSQKCQGVPFSPICQNGYFCSGPISVDPICPQPTGVCNKSKTFVRAFALQSSCRNSHPPPDLALRKLMFLRVFFSVGVLFCVTDTSMTMWQGIVQRFGLASVKSCADKYQTPGSRNSLLEAYIYIYIYIYIYALLSLSLYIYIYIISL